MSRVLRTAMRRLVAGAEFRENGFGRLVPATLDAFAPEAAQALGVSGVTAGQAGRSGIAIAAGRER
ncbi:hypothetical protein [Methylobacterium sp. SyP6R]|uniref:hypothetical protein n=1 Tax=Methylobacterium sp. SyP6R TaxID=2718876 RepID=UPI001F281D5B|nr:hypothetical protein [Methylobacterium sp. SyP6R]MCF4123763.1 hypothetical protein [Methylobacterium sp. SyP6R]